MKRKYGIGLLVVMITICAFATTAFSQACNSLTECPCDPTATDNCGDLDDADGCKECSKCPIGNIPCPGQQEGPQGTVISDNVNPFDYDGEAYPGDADYVAPAPAGFGAYGYCTNFNYAQNPFRDCKFIMDVCRCPQACSIVPGSKVAIQMIIKTPGVYFAGRADDDELNRIRFDLMGSDITANNAFCGKDGTGRPGKVEMEAGSYYYDANGNLLAYGLNNDNVVDIVNEVRHFPEIKFYRKYREYYDGSGKFRSEVYEDTVMVNGAAVQVFPLGGSRANSLDEVNKVIALESQGEYMFNDLDANVVGENSKECHIWVDIPPMRINPGEYTVGDKVRIVVRLVFNRESGGICPTCHAPDYCECERDIAIICCDQAAGGQGCMYFPYALFNAPGGWSTGIAITKNDAAVKVADMTATLTLTDQADNKFTYIKTDFTTPVWSFVLDGIMSSFTPVVAGTTPVGPAGSLKVDGNFAMDGYNFMNAGEFGCGTMPRGCNDVCGP